MKRRYQVWMAVLACVLLGGCGSEEVNLPTEVIDEDVDMVMYFSLESASVEEVNATLDALYEAIPDDEEAKRVGNLANALRGEVKRRYKNFHEEMTEAGVRGVAVVMDRHGEGRGSSSFSSLPKDNARGATIQFTQGGGRHRSYPSRRTRTSVIVLVRVEAGTEAEDVVDAFANVFGQPTERQIEDMVDRSKALGEEWIAFSGRDDLDEIDGSETHAQAWNDRLNEAPDGALRVAVRMNADIARDTYRFQQELAEELGDPSLAADAKEVLTDLDRVSLAIQLGDEPRLAARSWYMSEESAGKATSMTRDQLEGGKNMLSAALAGLPRGQVPSPDDVDSVFEQITIEQDGQYVDGAIEWGAVRQAIAIAAPTRPAQQAAEEISRDIRRAFGMRSHRPTYGGDPYPRYGGEQNDQPGGRYNGNGDGNGYTNGETYGGGN